jgi:hypothetical protein
MASEEEVAGYRCPADDAELYGWVAAHDPVDRSKIVLDHCEECGLVVTRAHRPPDVAGELDRLPRENGTIVAPNRRSWQAGIGGAQWAGLEPERRRLHLTPRAAELLLAREDRAVGRIDSRFSLAGYLGMLQTLVNAFTLRDNFFRNFRAGRLQGRRAPSPPAIALDLLVTALVALPLAVVALPLELLASLFGRGGKMRIEAAGPLEPGGVAGSPERG